MICKYSCQYKGNCTTKDKECCIKCEHLKACLECHIPNTAYCKKIKGYCLCRQILSLNNIELICLLKEYYNESKII